MQRTERREDILRTAAAMLDEMPVSAMSLNELSRRVGLAKSNVLRYFESREAVLLDLLANSAAGFLVEISERLPAVVDPSAPVSVRAGELASGLAASFEAHPMLSELLSAQAAVLERNVSTDVALRYKRGARDSMVGLAALLRRLVPELDEPRSAQATGLVIALVGALWTRGHPAPALVAAYEIEPGLAFMNPPFRESLDAAIEAILLGLVARSAAAR
ncbi:TetR family transcriptional regulator [Frankia sp. AiPs1]|uniref:TetR/AcrR family transcriptional regulator n=1 Tax=Frankia sp. AiPs1 TaxID=573493 RepID=UPI00204398C5|nr:TetR family transcriptional regulator [Frankia sp. AiPs1]MCM3921530.1 TetR family transcriptional regulator [Frankia sp. AiPs1]